MPLHCFTSIVFCFTTFHCSFLHRTILSITRWARLSRPTRGRDVHIGPIRGRVYTTVLGVSWPALSSLRPGRGTRAGRGRGWGPPGSPSRGPRSHCWAAAECPAAWWRSGRRPRAGCRGTRGRVPAWNLPEYYINMFFFLFYVFGIRRGWNLSNSKKFC